MFCKACIYDYLLQQKQELKRQQQKYDAQQEKVKEEERLALQAETEKQLKQFQKTETSLLLSETTVFGKKEYASSSSIAPSNPSAPLAITLHPHSAMISEPTKEKTTPEEYSKKLTAFWVVWSLLSYYSFQTLTPTFPFPAKLDAIHFGNEDPKATQEL